MTDWQWYKFSDLDVYSLYDILALRERVFVIEQQSFYTDLDYLDQQAMHLLAKQEDELAAYARLHIHDQYVHISRVLTVTEKRGQGLGSQLMHHLLDYSQQHYPQMTIKMSAQEYLKDFYKAFGFVTMGQPYDDEGVMHVDMELRTRD